MTAHALITDASRRRRLAGGPALARVLTSPTPGEILLGSDNTGGPVLRIPTTTTYDDLKATIAALADLLARLDLALDDIVDALAPTPDQVRAAYLSNGDQIPANLRSGLARGLFG